MTRTGSKQPVRSAALAVLVITSMVTTVSLVAPAASVATARHDNRSAAAKAPKEYAVFHTDFGTIKVQLLPTAAPQTVKAFSRLVHTHVYPKRLIIERAVKNFVVQSGSYYVDKTDQLNQIVNEPTINDEVKLPNTRGTLAMAKTGAPNTATTGFFFNVKDNPTLDTDEGGYTVFGKITSKAGLRVLDKIADDQTRDLSGELGSGFSDVPVQHLKKGAEPKVKNLVYLPKIQIIKQSSTTKAARTNPHRASATKSRPLRIMVTNDDGYDAPGIAAISSALAKLPNVRVSVVAPLANQSGTGGSTTKGKLKVTKVKTLDGMPAHAVDGYPADTVRAALDTLHLHPDLVVSGINAGQNLGPAVDLSGTVGAARAAVARGIPAVASSSGLGDKIRYNVAVPYVLRWVKRHESRLLADRARVHVLSMNVPSCSKGSVRRMVRIAPDLDEGDLSQALGSSNCRSHAAPGKTDVKAFRRGFATKSVVPAKPTDD